MKLSEIQELGSQIKFNPLREEVRLIGEFTDQKSLKSLIFRLERRVELEQRYNEDYNPLITVDLTTTNDDELKRFLKEREALTKLQPREKEAFKKLEPRERKALAQLSLRFDLSILGKILEIKDSFSVLGASDAFDFKHFDTMSVDAILKLEKAVDSELVARDSLEESLSKCSGFDPEVYDFTQMTNSEISAAIETLEQQTEKAGAMIRPSSPSGVTDPITPTGPAYIHHDHLSGVNTFLDQSIEVHQEQVKVEKNYDISQDDEEKSDDESKNKRY